MSWEAEVAVTEVEAAGRLISDTITRDFRASSGDLLDALDSARFSSHPYSNPPKEWPPSVDVVNARELPPVLIERYNAAGGQGTALCGIFPAIRRCWATVDDTLFLWRFDRWDGQCPEYTGEEQAICAVGLAKAKPGVFVEALQHIIILATPVELVLLGVCCSASNDGTDPYAELSLQPLPDYTVPTDGVTMTCVTTTENGRVFLGGRDGHIYELIYTTGMGWQKRCRKVCHTGGVSSFLSRWVVPNALKFGAVDSVVEIVVDEERHILYSRTQESKLQVFDLGKNGDSALKKAAEESRIGDQRDSRHTAGRAPGSRSATRGQKTNIVSLAPLSVVESKWLHVVAVTSDGRRIYMSTAPSLGTSGHVGGNGPGAGFERPSVLKVVTTRPAPSSGVSGGTFGSFPMGVRTPSEGGVLKVEAAHLSSGVLLVSDASPPTLSRLLVSTKDFTVPVPSSNLPLASSGTSSRSLRALRESVTVLGVEGRTLAVADVLPPSERLVAIEASVWESSNLTTFLSKDLDEFTRAKRLWARGELATQHILPRRRAIIISTMGQMEVVLNRPVDLLQRLLETNTLRMTLEDFFQRFGRGEGAAMCLLLAARLTVDEDTIITSPIAEKAADAFEDPRLVGLPMLKGGGTGIVNSSGGGFDMGQVVQEAEPVFSGAHEGLCLCAARLLSSVWEFPVMVVKGAAGTENGDTGGVIVSRLPMDALRALEEKVRSLEQFFRARRIQRRGQYGRVSGIGDYAGYGDFAYSAVGGDAFIRENGGAFDGQARSTSDRTSHSGSAHKRQRLPYSPAELVAMEARSMDSIRQLLRRSGEALLLLQLLSQHHVARLAQSLDPSIRQQLAQLTFHQFVCSQDGDRIATRLVAGLMEYYVAPDGRGTVDDISMKLREGCPSYYNESDYQFYQAVECLERAASTTDVEERERLAREALNLLEKVPETADLLSVCQRFEDIRFYEAVVELPLRKARALDPAEDAFNEHVGEIRRQEAMNARLRCYEVVTNALRSLKGLPGQNGLRAEYGSPIPAGARSSMDESTRDNYIRQIVQLGVRWPDRAFHERLYQAMIDLGLVKELLEMAGPDLVPFLQSAGSLQTAKNIHGASRASSGMSVQPPTTRVRQQISGEQSKYLELLSRYYVHKRQHAYAAHVLLRLAEMRQTGGAESVTLEQRFQYLSNAVLQAKSVAHGFGAVASSPEIGYSSLLELLEGKLSVLRFQMKIKEQLEQIALRASAGVPMETEMSTAQADSYPSQEAVLEETLGRAAKEKADELSVELKSITQLYNEYAVRFDLWEVCLEMLHFSNYAGDADNSHMRETWTRLLEQSLRVGGIAEACAAVRRVGPVLYPGNGGSIPLDSICLLLERTAEERVSAEKEEVGAEDIPRALLAACQGAPEPVQRAYDRLLASGTMVPSPRLKLRILRSLLAVLHEWAVSVLGQRVGSGALNLANGMEYEAGEGTCAGLKDRLSNLANRYMTEVRRLPLPSNYVESVSMGFRELEEMLQSQSF